MSYDAQASVAFAKTQVGYHEGYNNYNKFSPWQGLSAYNPWCASFSCCCAVQYGGYRFPSNSTFGYKGEAYCPTLKSRAQQEGLWRDKWWRAQPGDQVLFDWYNNGLIDHVEVVVYDDGNKVITIGGNTGNGCYYRTRDRTYIAGFYAHSQSSQAKPPINWGAIQAAVKLRKWKRRVSKPGGALKLGDTNNDVSIMAELLVKRGLLAKHSNTYNKAVAQAVWHLKKIYGLENAEGKLDGKIFEKNAAEALLNPKKR